MASLRDLDQMDWARIQCLAGSSARIPPLIRQLAYASTQEERHEASTELWTLVSHGEILYEAAPHVVRFAIPLLEHGQREDRFAMLYNLGWLCKEAAEPFSPPAEGDHFWTLAADVLREVEAGLPIYLRLFREQADLRNLIALILQWYPHRAAEFTDLLVAEYLAVPDEFLRAELLGCLGRVAGTIPKWLELVAAAAESTNSCLRYMAACQYLAARGAETPRPVMEILEVTNPDNSQARGYNRPLHLASVMNLQRAAGCLPRREKIALFATAMKSQTFTLTANILARALLLAVSESGAPRTDGRADSASGPPSVRVEAADPDWLSAVISCRPLWINSLSRSQPMKGELFAEFGLPRTRDEMIHLWEGAHGRPFPGASGLV